MRTRRRLPHVVLLPVLALLLGVVGAPTPARAATSGGPDWLVEVNRYRAAAGLDPVVSEPAWVTGLQHHFTYLDRTPASYRTGQYASAHTENPASPWYTSDGAAAGESSDLAYGTRESSVDFIDGWYEAPFHAIGMLRPGLKKVAFASTTAGFGYAGIDVIRGIDSSVSQTAPVLFPGPGVTTDMAAFGGESPDPTETCSFPSGTYPGLPLIAMLTADPAVGLTASLTRAGGVTLTSGSGHLCIVDEHHYTSSDAVYGPTGQAILDGDNAVLLIPDRPLTSGSWTATITQPSQPSISWTFGVDVEPPAVGAKALPAVTTAASATFSWAASDTGSGVSSFDVRYRRAGLSYGFGGYGYPAAWQGTTGRSVGLALSRGSTYCFSVRAHDVAGNRSNWSGERCTASPLDDRSLHASSGWLDGVGSTYYAGTVRRSTATAATLSLSGLVTRHLLLVAESCADCGVAGVYWNGRLVRQVSLVSSGTYYRRVFDVGAFSAVSSGTLVVKAMSSRRVYLDGVGVSRV